MGETRTFECNDNKDLRDALDFARSRTDGGRTEIKLNKDCTYHGTESLIFNNFNRVTIDMAGLAFMQDGNSGWKISRVTSPSLPESQKEKNDT